MDLCKDIFQCYTNKLVQTSSIRWPVNVLSLLPTASDDFGSFYDYESLSDDIHNVFVSRGCLMEIW